MTFKPSFFSWWALVNRQSIKSDLSAGLTGAILVLPQGMAYALIAGLPAEYGLYSAMVIAVIASIFGSSLHLVSGPTAAISIVTFSVVGQVVSPDHPDYISTVLTLTLLTGIIQIALGLVRMGALVNFVSHTVVLGFTAGAAVLIATSQVKYLLGISLESGLSFGQTWISILGNIQFAQLPSVFLGLFTLFSIWALARFKKKLPAQLIGILLACFLAWLLVDFQFISAQTLQMVNSVPSSLPEMSLPVSDWQTISALSSGALAVAVLALVEAVSIARAIAIRSGQRIDSNQEFWGQGLSNLVGSFFSCYPGSGSFTRSGVNYEAGAKTPLANVFTALLVGVVVLLFADVTSYLPYTVMAGSIMLIAYNLIHWADIRTLIKRDNKEAWIFTITFLSTLFVGLEKALYIGVFLSLVSYLRTTSRPRMLTVAPKSLQENDNYRNVSRLNLAECPQIKVMRLDESLYYGAADYFQMQWRQVIKANPDKRFFVLMCSGVNYIDLTGAEALVTEIENAKQNDIRVAIVSLKHTIIVELDAMGYVTQIGSNLFYDTMRDYLAEIHPQLDLDKCANCQYRVFNSCP